MAERKVLGKGVGKLERERLAMRVSVWSVAVNLALAAAKLAAGIAARSGALVSDAAHSASDVASTLIVIAGVKLGGRASDRDHPYGHERLECLAALLLAGLLLATGLAIGGRGAAKLMAGLGGAALPVPGMLALIAAAVSIVVKEAMYHVTAWAARRCRSGALKADAWHHRSDALSSVGSLLGVLGARLGMPALDPAASIVISAMILAAALGVFRDAAVRLTDRACDAGCERRIRQAALAQEGVLGVDVLRTRLFGERVYVDLEISADGGATLWRAHEIAERVHDAVEGAEPQVKHCMVHVNPAGTPDGPPVKPNAKRG